MTLLFLFAFVLINRTLAPAIIKIATAESKNSIEEDFSYTVYTALGSRQISYKDIFTVSCKEDGSVAFMNVNMAACYAVCADVIPALTARARSYNGLTVSVPMGSLSGIPALSGKGPDCRVRLVSAKSVSVRLESEFTEAGINQTLHTVAIVATVGVTLLVPGAATDIQNEVRIPIAETVLLGKVPDAYTEISRLTDDITEEEIDDIYDFGAY